MSHVCDGRDPSCVACGERARGHELVRAAMTVDDQLDDIKRARIWSHLEDQLAAVAPRRARWPLAVGGAAVAAAAAFALLARAPSPDRRHTLSVPVETTATSRLGPHTNAALVGPAQLDLVGAPGNATTVRLRSGTLLADFEGGAGRSLRIETPRAVIEVVGTLFAVELRGGETCTSVAHGRVRVTMTEAVVEVAGGEQYCTGGGRRPIAGEMRDALERHQTVITARVEPAAPVPIPPSAPARIEPAAPVPISPTGPARIEPAPPAPGPIAAPPAPARAEPPAPTSPVVTPVRRPAPAASIEARTPVTAPRTELATASPGGIDAPNTREPAPAPPAAPPPPPPPSADELYRVAETALAARDAKAADRALATLLAEHPGSPLVDQALYERARIAYQQGSWALARGHLDRLASIPDTLLAEPGRYLTCRIAVETRDGEAASCLAAYRKVFPRSPHDLEALALLVQLAHTGGGCTRAAALVGELVQTYPRTTLAAAWRTRCPERP